MAESRLTIDERDAGDVTILVLSGRMVLDDGDLAIGRRITELIERQRRKILLDLGGVTYMDSSGVGMLAFQLKAVRESGGDMKLLHLNRRAESLLGMMKLLIVFESFKDEAEALRSFARHRST